ncbi:hypothetical protein ACIBI3_38835 [Actinomadura luteofluorescens]|uniref:hypothetical protein n=1 Tax=Actinomadura luteofluorescens TaxID=46163 RepID=UPI0034764044
MAEVTSGPSSGGPHAVGHDGIGLECPVTCLGVWTVGDLLALLVEARRVSGLSAVPVDVGFGTHRHEGGQLSRACPLACLQLSTKVRNALRNDRDCTAKTVGDLLDLLWSHDLHEVRLMGARGVNEVHAALLAEGFSVPRRV